MRPLVSPGSMFEKDDPSSRQLAFGSRNHLQAGEICPVIMDVSWEVSGEEERS